MRAGAPTENSQTGWGGPFLVLIRTRPRSSTIRWGPQPPGKREEAHPDKWLIAFLSAAERQRITLPTIAVGSGDQCIDARHRTRRDGRRGYPPKSWPAPPRHTDERVRASQATALPPGGTGATRIWSCEPESFSATPMTSGRRCQAAEPQVIMGRISGRRRCKWVLGLLALVVN